MMVQMQDIPYITHEQIIYCSLVEVDTKLFQYVVVSNQSGGFVTGGGWIDSPVFPLVQNLTKSDYSMKITRGVNDSS